jgi:hypothetical protein
MKKDTIYKVKEWNVQKRSLGAYILVYTLGKGSMHDKPRQKGYVVQKFHKKGGERSRFCSNYQKALTELDSNF